MIPARRKDHIRPLSLFYRVELKVVHAVVRDVTNIPLSTFVGMSDPVGLHKNDPYYPLPVLL